MSELIIERDAAASRHGAEMEDGETRGPGVLASLGGGGVTDLKGRRDHVMTDTCYSFIILTSIISPPPRLM